MKLAAKFAIIFLILLQWSNSQQSSTVLFISDTQQPLWIETLRLHTQENERATQQLFSLMSRESCAAVFHLGDITALGMLDGYWKSFDTLRTMLPFPIYPAFGNHEYFIIPSWGKEQMLKRFPWLTPSWYRKQFGGAAIIVLNSNFSRLTEEENSEQDKWYRQTLAACDQDSSVSLIIVACHHSPYTNSTIVSPDQQVLQRFAVPFSRAAKSKLFISGHAHTSEHFHMNGKDFLVIGGGGGLQQPLRDTADADWIGPKQFERQGFHYVRLELRSDSIIVQRKMLNSGFSGVTTVGELKIGR